MLEVYHFVTPLSAESIASEEMIMSYFEEMNQFVSYKLIPIVTMQSVRDTYHELKRNYKNIDYATVANNLSQLVLDTKAVQSQGRKAARAFYFKMQTQLLANKTYSKNLVLSTIAELNLDENIFLEDYNTLSTLNALRDDQNIAANMGIVTYPTMVVYNSTENRYAFQTTDFSSQGLAHVFNSSMSQKTANASLHLVNYEEITN